MISHMLISLRKIGKQVVCMLLGVILCLGLLQPAAQAATNDMAGEPEISAEKLDQMRAQRRQLQSKASEAAAAEAEKAIDSVGKKLNLNEIIDENGLTGETANTTSRGTSR